jgi:gluconokinase
MGVSGCGKSSLAAKLAAVTGFRFIEGDAYHSTSNMVKMRAGEPLNDADREGWLERLCVELQTCGDAVLACSALKARYRDRLRRAAPDMRFVHLDINRDLAWERVAARRGVHPFPASLVASQFEALETPGDENDVLTLSAREDVERLCLKVVQWLDTA